MLQLNVIKNNLTQVCIKDRTFYFSYNTCIAIKQENVLTIDNRKYSRTTEGHKKTIQENETNNINTIVTAAIDKLII